MSEISSGPIPGIGYGLRQVVVATDLVALRGPVSGRWQLPLHLDASARAVYDVADPNEREKVYQLVRRDAASPADLEQWLAGQEFLRLWPELYLPRVVRAAWQTTQPVLAGVGVGPRVPPAVGPAAMIEPFQACVAQPAPAAATATTVTDGDANRPPAVLPVSVWARRSVTQTADSAGDAL